MSLGRKQVQTRAAICGTAIALAACAGRPNGARLEPAPVVTLAATVPAAAPAPAVPAGGGGGSTLRRGSCPAPTPIARFTLIHMNDLQARYSDRIAGRSRYGYIAGFIRAEQQADPDTLVLDAGDDYEKGAFAELRSMGESTRRMVQALPIDVRTIGNHDFAYGADAVLRDLLNSTHPVLGSNIRYLGHDAAPRTRPWGEQEEESPFASFVRVDVGCVRVGVVGLVVAGYGSNDYPSREPFDGEFEQDDRYEAVLTDLVRKHRADVDVFVALNHTGYGVDLELARRVSGVDIVVGGHTEDLLTAPTLMRRPDGTRAYVVQAGHWGLTLGRAEVAVDLRDRSVSIERYGIVNVDATLPYDEAVGDMARSVEQAAASEAHEAIAIVKSPIAQGKPMADLVFRAASERWGVDALVLGKDVFWDGLPAGPLTAQRLYDSVLVQREPSGTSGYSSLWLTEVSGATLLALRSHLIAGPMYAHYEPDTVDPARTYRLAIEKRALENPAMAMYPGGPSLGSTRYGGELIDLLLAYAKDRTQRGLMLE